MITLHKFAGEAEKGTAMFGRFPTQSRMSVPSSERPNRKRTNDRAPVRERADRKRMEGPGAESDGRRGPVRSIVCDSFVKGPVDKEVA